MTPIAPMHALGGLMRGIPELTDLILSHLPSQDLYNLAVASRYLQKLAEQRLWMFVDDPLAQKVLHGMFNRQVSGMSPMSMSLISSFNVQEYIRLFQILPCVRQWKLVPTMLRNGFVTSSLPLHLLGFSQPGFGNPLQSLKVLHFSTAGVRSCYGTHGPVPFPTDLSLPNLEHLIIDLNHLPPGPNRRLRQYLLRPEPQWWEPIGTVQPNYYTMQLVRQIEVVAKKLRWITVHGVFDHYIIGQLALMNSLEILDLTNAEATGPGSLENYLCISNMSKLLELFLPISLHPWASAASTPIRPPILQNLTMPTDDIYHDAHKALLAFHHPNITTLRLSCICLISAFELATHIRAFRSLQHLHIDLARWVHGTSIGDILCEIVEIPDLLSFNFFYYAGKWPMSLPMLDAEDAPRIWRAWPGLQSLRLGPVTFEFFQDVLGNMSELAELEVNAFCWSGEWPDVPDTGCTAMRSLIFAGRPYNWAADATSKYLAAHFPELQSINIAGFRGDASEWMDIREEPHPTYILQDKVVDDVSISREIMCQVHALRLVRAQERVKEDKRPMVECSLDIFRSAAIPPN